MLGSSIDVLQYSLVQLCSAAVFNSLSNAVPQIYRLQLLFFLVYLGGSRIDNIILAVVDHESLILREDDARYEAQGPQLLRYIPNIKLYVKFLPCHSVQTLLLQ